MRLPRSLALIAGTAALLAAAAPVTATAATAPAHATDRFAALTGTATLTGDVLGGIATLTPTGAVAPTQRVNVGVALTRPDSAGEDAYLADVYNPASADYRHFLTVPQWQARFGVSQTRYDAAVAYLKARGLTTTAVPGSTEYVLASGPAAAVESAFAVTLDTYRALGRDFYANTAAPTVPARLGVLDVVGLQSWTRMKTMQEWQKSLPLTPDKPAGVTVPASVNVGSSTPQDLWGVYDQPANNTGQGEKIAIFGWGATETSGVDVEKNLRTFESTYKLPQISLVQNHYGPAGEAIVADGGAGEWNLDLPASTGMAPGADEEDLYFGKTGADADIIAAYTAWNGDANGPRQGSSSFAGCEASPLTINEPGGPGNPPTGGGPLETAIGNPDQDAFDAQLKEAVELGRTMFVSSGDLGSDGCPYSFTTALNGATAVPTGLNNYPSDSDWTTAVGGTVLYINEGDATTPSSRFLEYSWSHTGGGSSMFIAAPDFQTKYLATGKLLVPCTTDYHYPPNTYTPGTLCRGIPDVSAQSGDIISNGYVAGAGTSLSSPLWVGMWTRIQAASSNPGRLGFASEAIYANNSDATKYANDFFDVGNPTNGATIPSCTNYAEASPLTCSAPGWDYLSGWGTPDVTHLMKDLDNGNTTPVAFAPADLPEAPAPVLLVGAAMVAAGGVLVVRRRRSSWRRDQS